MNNISAVRYILASSVILSHVAELMGFRSSFVSHWPIPSYIAVGGFFALSGYLIFGSYERRPVVTDFLRRRARRIMPAYISIVLMCAVGMVFVSSLPPVDYFTSSEWWCYLLANLSFLNFLQPTLPGVFSEYAEPAINGSLWTMKVEWMLYLSVPLVAWFCSRFRFNRSRVAVVIYLLSVAYRLLFAWLYEKTGNDIYLILGRQVFGQLSFFYTGVWIYANYNRFHTYRHWIAIVSLLLFLSAGYIPYYDYILEPAVISLLIIYACTTGRWGTWVPVKGNISYEMYLCHFPVIQLLIYFGFSDFGFWPCLLVTMTISALVSKIISSN